MLYRSDLELYLYESNVHTRLRSIVEVFDKIHKISDKVQMAKEKGKMRRKGCPHENLKFFNPLTAKITGKLLHWKTRELTNCKANFFVQKVISTRQQWSRSRLPGNWLRLRASDCIVGDD
ncbi:unnamed protein product [Ilex paraguariensis]|uniref:Uncharacterized protein n=1 Tax=Ilex paraguariensis TaxID=185542 RepID=A0ABC8S825_9AQUA